LGVNVSYKLTGSGWAECVLNVDGQLITMTASYLSHALENILQATIEIVKGNPEARASFDEEPGEYRWLFKRINEQQVNVKILWFDELWNNEPDENGQLNFEANCRLRTFAGAILSASQQVLLENGLAGYKNKWHEHDFPVSAQNDLKRLLDER
jgi:hypothetical protein